MLLIFIRNIGMLAAVLLVTVPASADEGIDKTANDLWNNAKQARKDKDWPLCRGKALAAWRIQQLPRLAILLGECEQRLGNHVGAAGALFFFRANHTLAPGHPLLAHGERLYQASLAHVARVSLSASVPSAVLAVDGRRVQRDPPPSKQHPGDTLTASALHLAPGQHTFTAQAPDFSSASTSRELLAATETNVTLTLVRTPVDTPPPPPPPPSTALPLWPALVGGGAGVALVIVGVVLKVGVAPSQQDDADTLADTRREQLTAAGERCPQAALCEDFVGVLSDLDLTNNLSTGMFAAGSGLLGVALIYGIIALTSDESTAKRIKPAAGPALAGLGLQIAF